MALVVEFYVSDKERKKCVKSFQLIFDEKYSKKIEKGIYDFSEQYCKSNGTDLKMAKGIYKDTASRVLYDCSQTNKTITKIIKGIKEGKYNSYNLAFLRPDEINTENWKKILTRKKTTEKKLNDLPTIDWRPCPSCKNTKFFYCQLQTRSADEPMTTFYTCNKCGKTIKENN